MTTPRRRTDAPSPQGVAGAGAATPRPPADTGLARLDLRRLFVDVDSLLGRAAAAGIETQRLPARFADTLMAWLRARALEHAQRRRTGIALARDGLRRGVEMAWTCIDLGLSAATGGDLEAAVERLAAGDLQTLHDRGYECAFAHLQKVASTAGAWLADAATLALLPEHAADLRRWARVVPETWIVPAAGRDDQDEAIDPVTAPAACAAVDAELSLAASLPRAATAQLLAAESDFERDLPHLLRRVWTALLLGRESLLVDAATVEAVGAVLRQGVSGAPLGLDPAPGTDALTAARAAFDAHLERAIDDPEPRECLRRAAHEQLQAVRDAAVDTRRLRLALRAGLAGDDAASARLQALEELGSDDGWEVWAPSPDDPM